MRDTRYGMRTQEDPRTRDTRLRVGLTRAHQSRTTPPHTAELLRERRLPTTEGWKCHRATRAPRLQRTDAIGMSVSPCHNPADARILAKWMRTIATTAGRTQTQGAALSGNPIHAHPLLHTTAQLTQSEATSTPATPVVHHTRNLRMTGCLARLKASVRDTRRLVAIRTTLLPSQRAQCHRATARTTRLHQ